MDSILPPCGYFCIEINKMIQTVSFGITLDENTNLSKMNTIDKILPTFDYKMPKQNDFRSY